MDNRPEESRPDQAAPGTTEKALDAVGLALQQITSSARVEVSFGPPHTVGDRTVIPVAEVFVGAGFGMGRSHGPLPEGSTGGGFGGGAGGVTRSRPVAAIVIEPDRVTVRPIVDATQIVLAALSVGAFGLLWARRLARRNKMIEDGKVLPSPKNLSRLLRS